MRCPSTSHRAAAVRRARRARRPTAQERTIDNPGLIFAALGLAAFAAALLPRLLGRVPVSMPMVFLGLGALVFWLVPELPTPDPVAHPTVTTHLTEVCVIVSLMGAGLALDRPIGWRGWRSPRRLIGLTMVGCIAVITLLGSTWLGLGLAAAMLLAAVLAPTDPVLASEVQVAEPAEEPDAPVEDEARFALTAEAGLNDGLAFPFTYAAVAISTAGLGWASFGHWVGVDLVWRLVAGVAVGLGAGWLLGKLFFNAPLQPLRLADHAEGFVALAATFLTYGLAELVHGYGFVAVFVCACAIRAAERSHGYHKVLHSWVEQFERLLTVLILVLLGGALTRGLLDALQPRDVLLVVAFLLVVRPGLGWLGMIGSGTGPRERAVIAFFGVRGIGSLFYISWALEHGDFAQPERLWAIVALTVAASVLLHGVTATPAMMLLDRERHRAAVRRHGDASLAPETAV
ncbi:MAG: sodium/hydrogen exchanger [uncultured Friedmanniella sp.]|uniref:Sodium/hydrogen exchanger n=1 Tax=uncultured Friedmanniella sp. TaxID=335381 RepID=A0A6J4KMK0_9ACTN|nr:MAG: sodium/hydrogen exchanger [uncultured Friedmanniella sp.]